MSQKQEKPNKEGESGLQSYARFSGLAFQMVAIILAFVWAGKKIDTVYFQGHNIFIIILSLVGVFIAIYFALKDLLKFTKKK